MNTLFLITARGGSKGIPGKNVRDFCGKPLVARSVEQAMALAGDTDTVCLSTDSDKIRAAAGACGLEVPFRCAPSTTYAEPWRSGLLTSTWW